jgi:hypothetical protein
MTSYEYRPFLAVTLAALLAARPVPVRAAQDPDAPKLNIVVIAGDGAINNIKSRTSREVIVEVQDENNKPVAGASVVFLLPNSGPGVAGPQGNSMITVMTDQNGRAAARGLRPNQQSGNYNIQVRANFQSAVGQTVIAQSNIIAAGAAVSGLTLAIIGIAAAAAGGTAYALTRNGNGGTPARPSVGVNPGTPAAGAPQ